MSCWKKDRVGGAGLRQVIFQPCTMGIVTMASMWAGGHLDALALAPAGEAAPGGPGGGRGPRLQPRLLGGQREETGEDRVTG